MRHRYTARSFYIDHCTWQVKTAASQAKQAVRCWTNQCGFNVRTFMMNGGCSWSKHVKTKTVSAWLLSIVSLGAWETLQQVDTNPYINLYHSLLKRSDFIDNSNGFLGFLKTQHDSFVLGRQASPSPEPESAKLEKHLGGNDCPVRLLTTLHDVCRMFS